MAAIQRTLRHPNTTLQVASEIEAYNNRTADRPLATPTCSGKGWAPALMQGRRSTEDLRVACHRRMVLSGPLSL